MSGVYGETINIDKPTFRRLKDNDTLVLAQAITMRLETRRGTYFDDPEYGLDLDELLLEGVTTESLARIAAEIAGEIEKEERVETATVTAETSPSGAGVALSFIAEITPDEGPEFSMTISIQDLTIEAFLRGT